jgi:PKD repeat protein
LTRGAAVTAVTRETGAPRDADAAAVQAGSGGGSKKWIWIAAAGGGAAAAAFALKERNAAPTVASASATPGTAIAGMNVSFAAQGATDPDGDALTFNWDFGDGSTGTGSTATHGYGSEGTFTVSLDVSDGKKSASTSTSVTIKSATGRWVGAIVVPGLGTCSTTTNLTQTFSSLSGNFTYCATDVTGPGSVSGSIDTAGVVTLTVSISGFAPFTFRGNPSADVNTLSGVITGSGFESNTWVMVRQ